MNVQNIRDIERIRRFPIGYFENAGKSFNMGKNKQLVSAQAVYFLLNLNAKLTSTGVLMKKENLRPASRRNFVNEPSRTSQVRMHAGQK